MTPAELAAEEERNKKPIENMQKLSLEEKEERKVKAAARAKAKEEKLQAEEDARKEEAAAKAKAKEEKLQAEEAAKAAAKAKKDAEVAELIARAAKLLDTGLKGEELKAALPSEGRPTGAAVVAEIFRRNGSIATEATYSWCTSSEYGSVLKALVGSNSRAQCALLLEVQRFCFAHKFPTLKVQGNCPIDKLLALLNGTKLKDKKKDPRTGEYPEEEHALLDLIFNNLYLNLIVDNEGFDYWFHDSEDVPGKTATVAEADYFLDLINGDAGSGDEEIDFSQKKA
jgi:hypothetical protein